MSRKLTKQEERLMLKYPETDTFLWHNENPKGHITGDCTIRALAGGMGISWNEALDGLHETERRFALCDIKAISKYLESQGWVKHKQPRHDDGSKYTGGQFAEWLSVKYPRGEAGAVICSVANHMFCIKPVPSGNMGKCRYKIFDIWNSTSKCIGNYWTKSN